MVIKTAEEFLQYLEKVTGHKPYEYRTKIFEINKELRDIDWGVFGCDIEDVEDLYEYIKEHQE